METAYEEFGYCHYLRLYAELREVYDEDGEVDEDAESELMNMPVSIRTVAEQRSFGEYIGAPFEEREPVENLVKIKEKGKRCKGPRPIFFLSLTCRV